MLLSHALITRSRKDWIVDSGATCHMCNDVSLFSELRDQKNSEKVILGDGCSLQTKGQGTVDLEMFLADGASRRCDLKNVLYVPELEYNLLSVSRAAEAGKTVKFNSSGCEFTNEHGECREASFTWS